MTLTRIDIDLTEHEVRRELIADASRGLGAPAKVLPPKYFYDQRGSELFEQITRLPEYYPTRVERRILSLRVDEVIAAAPRFTSLVELGSGSSSKTPMLLDAMQRRGVAESYVPVDVSVHAMANAVDDLRERYPSLPIHGVVTDFERPLRTLPRTGDRMMALLGSTIGNLEPAARVRFLNNVVDALAPGESFLLGVDLVKDTKRLVKAYDDAAGTTRSFNLNMLNVLNRLLRADFDAIQFDHVALWNEEQSRIEMRLRAREAMKVRLGLLDTVVAFEDGEEIRTEISTKFRRETLESEFNTVGLELAGWWDDRESTAAEDRVGEYAVVLGVRA